MANVTTVGAGLGTIGFPAPGQPGVPKVSPRHLNNPGSACPICYYLLMFAVTEKSPVGCTTGSQLLFSLWNICFPFFWAFFLLIVRIPVIVRQGGCYKCGEGCQRFELAFTNVSLSSMLKCSMSKRSISESNSHPQMFQSHLAFALQYTQSICTPFL